MRAFSNKLWACSVFLLLLAISLYVITANIHSYYLFISMILVTTLFVLNVVVALVVEMIKWVFKPVGKHAR
ncbi:hypothetical protein NSQ54_19830 [Alkalihalobacillus sp. FSL W8-0930]